MRQIRRYSTEQMKAIIATYARKGGMRAVALVGYSMESLILQAQEIAVDKGMEEYGDKSFLRSESEMIDEARGECHDLFFYTSVAEWIKDGRPVVW